MATTNSPKTMYLAVGLAEGPLVTSQFRQQAMRRGFDFVDQPSKARYLVAHSAGCYMLNSSDLKQHITLVGPPHLTRSGRSLLKQVRHKLRHEYQTLGFIKFCYKNYPNLLYSLNIPRGLVLRRKVLAREVPATNITIIRNQHDNFSDSTVSYHQSEFNRCISLPGGHDDIWINPKPYLDILEAIYV